MLRGKIERAVERLLTILDDLDGDPDLEPTNGGSQDADRDPATTDAEAEDEHGGDVLDEGDATAPERHGAGFVACSADDIEADERLREASPCLTDARRAALWPFPPPTQPGWLLAVSESLDVAAGIGVAATGGDRHDTEADRESDATRLTQSRCQMAFGTDAAN